MADTPKSTQSEKQQQQQQSASKINGKKTNASYVVKDTSPRSQKNAAQESNAMVSSQNTTSQPKTNNSSGQKGKQKQNNTAPETKEPMGEGKPEVFENGGATEKKLIEWSVQDVATWLQQNGLDMCRSSFTKNQIDGQSLPYITLENLKEDLRIFPLGIRIRLWLALTTLLEEHQQPRLNLLYAGRTVSAAGECHLTCYRSSRRGRNDNEIRSSRLLTALTNKVKEQ